MDPFLSSTLSMIVLLALSVGVAFLSKLIRLPYTVALVAVGLMIGLLVSWIPALGFLDDFVLTPEILLYVFLPVLLYESAFNIRFREFIHNLTPITLMAVVSLFVSALIIGGGISLIAGLFGIEIPFIIALLFGSLISATDPVAVLALFKQFGAPRRLTLLFEGESLFNDGTALALFSVILGLTLMIAGVEAPHANLVNHALDNLLGSSFSADIIQGVINFSLMVGVGILFGLLIGVVFSKVIEKTKHVEFVEIVLTMILAHTTFILADVLHHSVIPTSGVIATVVSAMVMGNYGRYKISQRITETMEQIWGFLAFISNSLVFLLVGMMIISMHIVWSEIWLVALIAIIIVMIARAISVYLIIAPYNYLSPSSALPMSWQHLLSWGSLRGALSIIMVLLIPADLTMESWTLDMSIRDFIMAVTIACIVFTTFIKATTIAPMMKRFAITNLHDIERVEMFEGKILMLLKVLTKIDTIFQKGYISDRQRTFMTEKYQSQLSLVYQDLSRLTDEKGDTMNDLIHRVLSIHMLHLEIYWLKHLYLYHEIVESEFKWLLHKLDRQLYRIENGQPQIRGDDVIRQTESWLIEKGIQLAARLDTHPKPLLSQYFRARTRQIIADKSLKELQLFEMIDFIKHTPAYTDIIALYQGFYTQSREKKEKLIREHSGILIDIDTHLVNKSLFQIEETILDELHEKEILTPKLYHQFKEEVEKDIAHG